MHSYPILGSEASICFRCQYRIATRTRASQPHSPRPRLVAPARNLSTVRTLRQEQEVQAQKPVDLPIRFIGLLSTNYEKRPLYVDALGKPAKVLVAGESEQREPPTLHREYVGNPEAQGVISGLDASKMLDTIAAERGLVNAGHIQRNIGDLREQWLSNLQDKSGRPTALEVETLAGTLMDGFTEKQLHTYYEQTTLQPLTPRTELDNAVATGEYQRSAWRPRVSSFPPSEADLEPVVRQQILNGPDETFQSSDLQRFTSDKRNFVEKIIRKRWRIRSKAEEETVVGEVDMYLQPEYLDLLRNHNSEILTTLSERYDAKIQVSRSHHLLRLSATYDSCRDLLKLIVVILGNIRRDEVQIPFSQIGGTAPNKDLPHYIFEDSLLDHVSELTNVVIKPLEPDLHSKSIKVLLYSLGKDDRDIDDVCRLLSQAFRASSSSQTIQLVWPENEPSRVLANPMDIETGLQWTERKTKWFRFAKPSTHGTQRLRGQEDPAMQYSFEHLNLAMQKMKAFLLKPEPYAEVPFRSGDSGLLWQSSAQRKLSAILGHVLFAGVSAQSGTIGALPAPPTSSTSNERRSFLSNSPVPGFWPLLDKLTQKDSLRVAEQKSEIDTTGEVWIRLVPTSISQGAQKTDLVLPDIELCVCVDTSTNIAQLDKVNLMLSSRESDILLPEEATDLRFTDQTFITSGSSFEETISQFVQASNLDTFGQERLRTPPKAQILIPKHALLNAKRTRFTKVPNIPDEGLLAEYAFSTLEHRSSLSTSYEGCKLQYSIIEAGKTGGRRSEVRLIFAEPTSSTTDTLATQQTVRKDNFKQFFNAANRLVRLVGVKPLTLGTVKAKPGNRMRVRNVRLRIARQKGIKVERTNMERGRVRKINLDFEMSPGLEEVSEGHPLEVKRTFSSPNRRLRRVRSDG